MDDDLIKENYMKKTVAILTALMFTMPVLAQTKPAEKKEEAKGAVKQPPPPNIPEPKHATKPAEKKDAKPAAKPADKPAEKKEAKK